MEKRDPKKKKRDQKDEAGFSMIELLITSVILILVIGILSTITMNVQAGYARMRPRSEALNDATAALDMITRLVRMAGNNPNNISAFQPINAGTPTGGVYRTIALRGDWRGNAAGGSAPDGDTTDQFEHVRFLVSNDQLMIEEPPGSTPQVFLDRVNNISFTYFTTEDIPIVDPVASAALISRVNISIVMQTPDTPTMTFESSAYVRQR